MLPTTASLPWRVAFVGSWPDAFARLALRRRCKCLLLALTTANQHPATPSSSAGADDTSSQQARVFHIIAGTRAPCARNMRVAVVLSEARSITVCVQRCCALRRPCLRLASIRLLGASAKVLIVHLIAGWLACSGASPRQVQQCIGKATLTRWWCVGSMRLQLTRLVM